MNIERCVYPRCNNGSGEPVLTSLVICEACRQRYIRLLRWLADDYVHLHIRLPRPVRRGVGGRRSGKSSYGHPSEWASDQASKIARSLNLIEEGVRESLGLPQPLGWDVVERRMAAASLEFLVRHFDALCTYAYADASAAELVALHGEVRAALGHVRRRNWLSSPCPRCSTLGLFTSEATTVIECANCGHIVRPEFLEYLTGLAVKVIKQDDDALLDAYDTDPVEQFVADNVDGGAVHLCIQLSSDTPKPAASPADKRISVTLDAAPHLYPKPADH